jgi:hypothetical protein
MSANLPFHPFEEDDEGNPVYPDKLPGETGAEAVARIRKMRDDHEAAKSPQQRLRERKEREAFGQSVDTVMQAFCDRLDAAFTEPDEIEGGQR